MNEKEKNKRIVRQKMPEQAPKERAKNFQEVLLGFDEKTARLEAERCLQCKNPPCVKGCPAEVKIPEFIKLIKNGKFNEAAQKIKETNALPAVCGRVCPQETQCEEVCVLAKKSEPVSIGKLEMFCADYEREHDAAVIPENIEQNGYSIGVVGGGPGGIACAGDLIRLGYSVTVYEALHQIGGVLIYGIPEFRLSNDTVDYEIENLKRSGVIFKTNVPVGMMIDIDELLEEHDALFVATGAGLPIFLNIEGENLNGVYSANEYLTRVNLMGAFKFPDYDTPVIQHKNVVVVGGGNVAMDSCRTALRLGAKNAYCLYRRSEKEMPARVEEIEHAKEEGVQFHFLASPIRILDNGGGFVGSVEYQNMRLGDADESGRRRPVPIEGNTGRFEADAVIMALGNRSNPILTNRTPEIETNKWDNIVVDNKMMTSKERVFAGGDIVHGAATVILAIGDGKKAARRIDEFVQNHFRFTTKGF